MAELTQQELEAIWAASGRDPSQREQILASQSLLPTDYYVPNYMNYGGGYTTGQKPDVGLYPGKEYVLVDNRTGQTLASGSTPEDFANIRSIIETQLVPQGGKADWSLVDMGGSPTGATLNMHTTLPSGVGEAVKVGDAYGIPIAGDRPNNFFTDLFLPMIAPIAATAGAYFGGNALLGAGGGGGAGAGAAGAGLAEGASLAPGALASLPANLAAIQSGANAALAGAGLGAGAAGAAGTGLLSAAAPGAFEAAPIVVTAGGSNFVLPSVAALTAAGTTAAATSGATGAAPGTSTTTTTNTTPPTDSVGPDLVVNAKVNPPPSLTDSLLSGAASTVLPEVGPLDTPTSKSVLDNLTKNLGVTDYLTLASLLGSAVAGGGGGGTTAGTPYVSPFGTGGTMAGGDFRASPAISNYEQYGFGPEASFFRPEYYGLVSGGASKGYTPLAGTTTTPTYTPLIGGGTTTPTTATPTTTPAATRPATQTGGGVIATPENTGMTQERLDSLQSRYENMRSGDFFNYFKAVNDVLGNYAAKGIITPDIAKQYQSRLETAASVPNATLATLQAAVPMPQISDFLTPTGTQQPVEQQPAPQTQMTYTPPAEPITDPNRYVNDLFKQIGAQYSQGLLSIDQARNIQQQLQSAQKQFAPVDRLQSIYNTALQQYRPLI